MGLTISVCFLAWSYHHRDEKIQADINKLYDTHPTPSHSLPSSEDDNVGHSRSHHHGYREQASPSSVSEGDTVPVFDLNNSPNVTAVLDKTAILNCRVKDVGNKTVNKTFITFSLVNPCRVDKGCASKWNRLMRVFCQSPRFWENWTELFLPG